MYFQRIHEGFKNSLFQTTDLLFQTGSVKNPSQNTKRISIPQNRIQIRYPWFIVKKISQAFQGMGDLTGKQLEIYREKSKSTPALMSNLS